MTGRILSDFFLFLHLMAKGFAETDALCRELVADARKKIFRPVYLLMGDEPFYPDMVCDAIIQNALDESERDFNQSIYYGADTNAETVITTARRYPMFAERQLVVVKEAQMMKSLEDLSIYCTRPLDSTVLVICMHGASADKRKSLYKSVLYSRSRAADFSAFSLGRSGRAALHDLSNKKAMPRYSLFGIFHIQCC